MVRKIYAQIPLWQGEAWKIPMTAYDGPKRFSTRNQARDWPSAAPRIRPWQLTRGGRPRDDWTAYDGKLLIGRIWRDTTTPLKSGPFRWQGAQHLPRRNPDSGWEDSHWKAAKASKITMTASPGWAGCLRSNEAKYYQHIIYRDRVIVDAESVEYGDLAAAIEDVLSGLRGLAAADLAAGREIVVRRIEVRNKANQVVAQASLAEVLASVVPFGDDEFFADIASYLDAGAISVGAGDT